MYNYLIKNWIRLYINFKSLKKLIQFLKVTNLLNILAILYKIILLNIGKYYFEKKK